MKSDLKYCPTCGSPKIQRVRKDWQGESNGQKYTVKNVEFDECPDCSERIFDRNAVRQIQQKSPAFKQRRQRKAA